MKRFLIWVCLVCILLTSACAEIESPTNSNSSADTSEEVIGSSEATSVDFSADTSMHQSENADSSEESFVIVSDDVPSSEASTDESREASKDISVDNSSSQAPVVDNSTDISYLPVPSDRVFVSNGLLINGTRGMEQYFGLTDSGTKFSNIIANYKKDLGDSVNVYTVVAPHASNYYAPESYSNLIERGKINFDNLKAQNGDGVKYVDVYSALWDHVDEPIYPRTECHWGALAAYYAAEAFAKVAGVPFAPLDSYTKIVKPGFVGSVYTFSKAEIIRQNPEDFLIFMPQTNYTAYYYNQGNYDLSKPNFTKNSIVFDTKSYAGAFICGDNYTIKVVTGNNTGRKLVIFKDSYGNAFAPFTLGSFDEVYIVDIRYYKKNGVNFCKEVGATDVAVSVSAFTATGSVYKHLERIRTAP